MVIRIFGITTPTGEYLYKKILRKNNKNIFCYSRSNKDYKYLDLRDEQYSNLNKKCSSKEIWIFLCPIWEAGNFLDKLLLSKKFQSYNIRGIICCSSTSTITKKFSWHQYDKKLISRISSSENKIIKICNLTKTCLSIIRPTLIYGDYGLYKDKNINSILKICKKLPFIVLPTKTGKRQPLHFSQLAKIIKKEIKRISGKNSKNTHSILNIGGDEILTYEMIVRSLVEKRKIKKSILTINNDLFFLIFSPLLILNSKLYSEILRINSDLSGFEKSNIFLEGRAKKFIDFI